MVKAIVIYQSKFGNTRLVAETIVEGMNQVSDIDAMLTELSEVNLTQINEFDAILVGAPNNWGRPRKDTRDFIDKLGKLNLENKQGAVFDTCFAGQFEKAVKIMERQIGKKVPGLTLVAPGLSVKVDGMKGPVTEGELPKCKEFGIKIATQIKA
jgi:menaquinone-dependent protoporphyrinogen IX oxidase